MLNKYLDINPEVAAAVAEGKPVVIADPQLGSIQDVQLKAALDSAGIGYTTKSA